MTKLYDSFSVKPFKITEIDDVIKEFNNNYIHLNMLDCINPNVEYCEQLGRTIINMLESKKRLLPMYLKRKEDEVISLASYELASLTKMLYFSIGTAEFNLVKDSDCKKDIMKEAEDNHIWLNAFYCINPSPEYCINIGKTIINKLTSKNKLNDNQSDVFKTMYMSINKS